MHSLDITNEMKSLQERARLQNEADSMNRLFETWYSTRAFSKNVLLNGRLYPEDADHMDSIIQTSFDGVYSLKTLDDAYRILIKQKKLAEDLIHFLESNPEFSVENQPKVSAWIAEHSNSDISDLVAWINFHRLDGTFKWVISTEKLVGLLRVADKKKIAELKAQYGDQAVNQAWNILQDRVQTSARGARNKEGRFGEEAQRDQQDRKEKAVSFFEKLKEMNAKNEAEAVVSSYRSVNHADTKYYREQLESVVVYKDEDTGEINWPLTAAARKSKLQSLTDSNPYHTNLR